MASKYFKAKVEKFNKQDYIEVSYKMIKDIDNNDYQNSNFILYNKHYIYTKENKIITISGIRFFTKIWLPPVLFFVWLWYKFLRENVGSDVFGFIKDLIYLESDLTPTKYNVDLDTINLLLTKIRNKKLKKILKKEKKEKT